MTPERIASLKYQSENRGMEEARVKSMKQQGIHPSPEISAMVAISTTELKEFLSLYEEKHNGKDQ